MRVLRSLLLALGQRTHALAKEEYKETYMQAYTRLLYLDVRVIRYFRPPRGRREVHLRQRQPSQVKRVVNFVVCCFVCCRRT